MATFAETYKALFKSDPPPLSNERLKRFWNVPVSRLCELDDEDRWRGPEAWNERHRLYSQLLMAIIHRYWNGWKRGRPEDPARQYPWNDLPRPGDRHLNGDYYGHNIGALAVDQKGYVLDFDFNHNELFSASTEHAEARLVRRLFGLAQISASWGALPAKAPNGARGGSRRRAAGDQIGNEAAAEATGEPRKYTTMKEVTVYTSLESCAQCAGIMALARVRWVVYLQTDPGVYFIGRILRNLTPDGFRAPLPISGAEIDAPAFSALDDAYADFVGKVKEKPFWIPARGAPDTGASITSFLCTGSARRIFGEYGKLPAVEELHDPVFRPVGGALTNAEVLEEARDFLDYATSPGRRGTPHNL